jgi:hypothetical protein
MKTIGMILLFLFGNSLEIPCGNTDILYKAQKEEDPENWIATTSSVADVQGPDAHWIAFLGSLMPIY